MVARATFALALTLFSAYGSAEELQLHEMAVTADGFAPPVVCESDTIDCDCCGSGPFWFAGTEVTFLGFDARTGGQVNLSFSDTTAPGVSTVSILDGNGLQDFAYAPRVWLGRQISENWAVVGRFWQLTDFATKDPTPAPGTTFTGTNFATITDTSRVRLSTIDIEGIRSFTTASWKVDASLGVRHASLEAQSAVVAFGVFTTGNFVNVALSNGSSFDGTGMVAGLIGRRQIGDTPASLFLGARGSALWGNTDSFGRAVGTVASSPSAPLVGAATVTRANAVATSNIFELQVGVQWDFQIYDSRVNSFFRTAFEYQHWNVAGLPTGGAGFDGTIGELTTNSFSSAGLPGAELYGLSLATGFTW